MPDGSDRHRGSGDVLTPPKPVGRARRARFVMAGGWLLALSLCAATAAMAQAPPPLQFVPRADRARLDAERDVKGRTRLSITLAEAHLARAEQLTAEGQYDEVIAELGFYQGVVDDALKFLAARPAKKGKTLDNFKRLELALHTHVTRLEAMRRETPASYGVNLKAMIEYVRDARDHALAGFYDNAILSDLDAGNALTPVKKPEER